MFVKRVAECPEFIAGDDTRLREILHPTNDPVQIGYSIASARLAIGEASTPHRLRSSETYYVLQGKAKFYIDDDIQEAGKDTVVYVPANALQFVENISSEELVVLCIVEPFWKASDESTL